MSYVIQQLSLSPTIRIVKDWEKIREEGAEPSLREQAKERLKEKYIEKKYDPTKNYQANTAEEYLKNVCLKLDDVITYQRKLLEHQTKTGECRGQTYYGEFVLDSAKGLMRIEFVNFDKNLNIPTGAILDNPAVELFSLTINNDFNSNGNIKFNTNEPEESTKAKARLYPGEKHTIDWKTGKIRSINIVAESGTPTIRLIGMY